MVIKTSKFRGVYALKHLQRWRAAIRVRGVQRSLGNFLHEEDAARAYDDAARAHGRSERGCNFPREGVDLSKPKSRLTQLEERVTKLEEKLQ